MLEIIQFVLGPVATNTYLVVDSDTKEAVVIDPAWEEPMILERAGQHAWQIRQIWITHAHFDHTSGTAYLIKKLNPAPVIGLHPADLPIWQSGGGAAWFGLHTPRLPNPAVQLSHGQSLCLGETRFEVRHVPGHSPGHVVFYCAEQGILFCGDTVFMGSIGRTDLPGGDTDLLLRKINSEILSLPEPTRLLCGHGDETSIGQEKRWNPFLA